MSDKKKRTTYTRKFKRDFLKGYENDNRENNKKFVEYCQEHNIRCHTAKLWYTQLNINSPFSKATLDSGEDVDDFDLGGGEEEDDLDDDGEDNEEYDESGNGVNRKTRSSLKRRLNEGNESIIQSDDDLSSNSSTVIGLATKNHKTEQQNLGLQIQQVAEVNEGGGNNQIQINRSKKQTKVARQSTWVLGHHLLAFCGTYRFKDANIKLLVNANGTLVMILFVNITLWFFLVYFVATMLK